MYVLVCYRVLSYVIPCRDRGCNCNWKIIPRRHPVRRQSHGRLLASAVGEAQCSQNKVDGASLLPRLPPNKKHITIKGVSDSLYDLTLVATRHHACNSIPDRAGLDFIHRRSVRGAVFYEQERPYFVSVSPSNKFDRNGRSLCVLNINMTRPSMPQIPLPPWRRTPEPLPPSRTTQGWWARSRSTRVRRMPPKNAL